MSLTSSDRPSMRHKGRSHFTLKSALAQPAPTGAAPTKTIALKDYSFQ
ncbi:MAG: hypothetical protein WBA89_06710 [Microcoleus sp.]